MPDLLDLLGVPPLRGLSVFEAQLTQDFRLGFVIPLLRLLRRQAAESEVLPVILTVVSPGNPVFTENGWLFAMVSAGGAQ